MVRSESADGRICDIGGLGCRDFVLYETVSKCILPHPKSYLRYWLNSALNGVKIKECGCVGHVWM